MIHIEVAYARPEEQVIIPVEMEEGATAEQAIQQSKIHQRFTEINLLKQKIGIFSKACKLDTVLRDGDRIEIYRPLIADPKAVRKKRAAEGKAMRKGTD
ncbi:RnfH family protein [Candidatus Albibeggiatoa sp. nov. BB20]|uniref:RnfH family protein n=1 Tax=Candidatus Albibeggiatoa sp. nov. BB20 TaxID=3162723 RepID=UPI003365748B